MISVMLTEGKHLTGTTPKYLEPCGHTDEMVRSAHHDIECIENCDAFQ